MCSVVILLRPDHDWPVLLAANRDERLDRQWRAPARHWPDRPEITGGMDVVAGGSWLAINDHGVLAILLNTPGSLGPDPEKRSRGELVLEALDHADAVEAAQAMASLDPVAYRPFHLLIADNRDVFLLSSDGDKITLMPLAAGLFMITAHGLDNPQSPRFRHYQPLFAQATVPHPLNEDWRDWVDLMTDRGCNSETGPGAAMFVATDHGYGTSSTALMALSSIARPDLQPVFRFVTYETEKPEMAVIPPFVGQRHFQS